MTLEQQKRVEDNHNLIYSFLRKFNLDREEYYDLCAIGLCKASINYNEEKGKFSTLAYICMHNEIKSEWRKSLRTTEIPKELIIYYQNKSNTEDEDCTLEDYLLKSDCNLENECIVEELIGDFLTQLSNRDKEIVKMFLQGYKQREIGRALNVSQSWVNKIIKRLREFIEG